MLQQETCELRVLVRMEALVFLWYENVTCGEIHDADILNFGQIFGRLGPRPSAPAVHSSTSSILYLSSPAHVMHFILRACPLTFVHAGTGKLRVEGGHGVVRLCGSI